MQEPRTTGSLLQMLLVRSKMLILVLLFFSSVPDWINTYEIGDCGIRYNKLIPSAANGTSSKLNEFPWHVALYRMDSSSKYDYLCGGSIIDTNVVLTAAHCVYEEDSKMFIATGKYNGSWEHRDVHEQRFEVISKKVPLTYTGEDSRYQDDIALLALNDSIKFSSAVVPVCIDWGGLYEPNEEEVGTCVGWGHNKAGVWDEILQVNRMQPQTFGECHKKLFKKDHRIIVLTSDKFCAKYNDSLNSPVGMGGGGLVFGRNQSDNETDERYMVKGILSIRIPTENYLLFTNISNHIPWLSRTLMTIRPETNVIKVSSSPDWINAYEIRGCGTRYNKLIPSVANGTSSKHNEFPWHVALFRMDSSSKYEYICGGSIIDTNVVLTAAHCVYEQDSKMFIAAGKYNGSWEHRDVHEQRFEVISKKVHPTFRDIKNRYQDDIALLALNDSIKFSSAVMPVCIDWDGLYEPNEEEGGTYVGWNYNETGALDGKLKVIKMQQQNFGECRKNIEAKYVSFLASDKFCAKYRISGGGLMFSRNQNDNETDARYLVKGILSIRAPTENYFLFTNISNHIPWLFSTLKTILAETNVRKRNVYIK